jgi:hypothetical protein
VELKPGVGTVDEGKVGSGGVIIVSLVGEVVSAMLEELLRGRPEAVEDSNDDEVLLVGVTVILNGAGAPGADVGDEEVALAGAVDPYGALLFPPEGVVVALLAEDTGYPVVAELDPVSTSVLVVSARLVLVRLAAVGRLELVEFEATYGGEEVDPADTAEVNSGVEVSDEKLTGGMIDPVDVDVVRWDDDVRVNDAEVGIGIIEALDEAPGPVGIGVTVALVRPGPMVVFAAEVGVKELIPDSVADVSETANDVDEEL